MVSLLVCVHPCTLFFTCVLFSLVLLVYRFHCSVSFRVYTPLIYPYSLFRIIINYMPNLCY